MSPDIGIVVRVFSNAPGDLGSIPGRIIPKTQKMVFDASWFNSIIRYVSRVKWSNSGKGVAPFPTPRCSSYWKERLGVTLDYGPQLYSYLRGFLVSCFSVLLLNEYLVTSVTGALILSNPWVWYCHNLQLMMKMKNQNITQSGTQTTGQVLCW